MTGLISYREAIQLLLENLPSRETEAVNLRQSLGRVLAEDLRADLDIPPFEKSVMDGYALKAADTKVPGVDLRIVGNSFAGGLPSQGIDRGETFQVMTGAAVPAGADAVQMVEKTRRKGRFVEILESVEVGANITRKGSEVRRGRVVLVKGQIVGTPHIGVLASFGHTKVRVFKRPSIRLVSTGDELVPPEQQPGPGQIRNSNLPMLEAQAVRLGCRVEAIESIGDEREMTERALDRDADILVFSGGVSMGEKDFVHKIVKESDTDVIFHKAAIRPGKPILYGRRDRQLLFGLPGNPVSSFVTFELFVRPAVRNLMGFLRPHLPSVTATLTERVERRPGRLFFMPGRLVWSGERFEATPIRAKGSADLTGFSRTNALLVMPAAEPIMRAHSRIRILMLEQFFAEGGDGETNPH